MIAVTMLSMASGKEATKSSSAGPAADHLPPKPAEAFLNERRRERLCDRIRLGEDWMIARIIAYAKRQDYTRYTSTLEEAWRVSIHDLSKALMDALKAPVESSEFSSDEVFQNDPMSAFAVLEADLHRRRGTELRMFLGLFKYYRQTFVDWLCAAGWSAEDERSSIDFVVRLFDRWEIAFCSAWRNLDEAVLLGDLQETNRAITNEKNRFLTVTESLGSPVILFDEEGCVTYVNQAAAPLLALTRRPGGFYYGAEDGEVSVPNWLAIMVRTAGQRQSRSEQALEFDGEERVFEARLSPMLDVSDKFQGTVVILHDITALRLAEKELAERARQQEQLAITDPLTGLLNRRGLEVLAEKQIAMALRSYRPLGVLYLDMNDLKAINDRFGHAAGDATIGAVATALETTFRVSDVIARVGGDEFVVLLPGRGAEDTSVIRERIAANLKEAVTAAGLEIDVEFSIGWTELDQTRHRDFEQLIDEADAAMYAAKRERHDPTTS